MNIQQQNNNITNTKNNAFFASAEMELESCFIKLESISLPIEYQRQAADILVNQSYQTLHSVQFSKALLKIHNHELRSVVKIINESRKEAFKEERDTAQFKDEFQKIQHFPPRNSLSSSSTITTPYIENMQKFVDAVKPNLEWWEQSCYIDALLAVIYGVANPWWRIATMGIPITKQNYRLPEDNLCSIDIDNDASMRLMASRLQSYLINDYQQLLSANNSSSTSNRVRMLRCENTRNVIAECIPSMKSRNGNWVNHEAFAIYKAFASMFPRFLILHLPQYTFGGKSYKVSRQPVIMFSDYLDDSTPDKEIDWKNLNEPFLVFYNAGMSKISDFDVASKNGRRAFTETILDHRYRLIAVVTLQGVEIGKDGGAHYISRFFGEDGNWWLSNSINTSNGGLTNLGRSLSSLPRAGIWSHQNGQMPSMYFYERISNQQQQLKSTTTTTIIPREFNFSDSLAKSFENLIFLDYDTRNKTLTQDFIDKKAWKNFGERQLWQISMEDARYSFTFVPIYIFVKKNPNTTRSREWIQNNLRKFVLSINRSVRDGYILMWILIEYDGDRSEIILPFQSTNDIYLFIETEMNNDDMKSFNNRQLFMLKYCQNRVQRLFPQFNKPSFVKNPQRYRMKLVFIIDDDISGRSSLIDMSRESSISKMEDERVAFTQILIWNNDDRDQIIQEFSSSFF